MINNNITNIIITASTYMDNEQYDKAIKDISLGISYDPDNYELIFMEALCKEKLGFIEYAYYDYRLAIYLAKKSPITSSNNDLTIIQEQFNRMCSYCSADSYKLGKALENLIMERIRLKEYNNTFEFLKLFIYDTNSFSANINLTETNMLLFMMLEIYNCEHSHSNEQNFRDIFQRFNNSYDEFYSIYYPLKFALRRIWFGIDYNKQIELIKYIQQYNISADMLAVLTKYCIESHYWYDAFNKITLMIKPYFPTHSIQMHEYSQLLISTNSNISEPCLQCDDFNNNAAVHYLNYRSISISTSQYSKVLPRTLDSSRISIIFCTNSDIYANECIMYLKHLHIPDNMTLDIIPVINAPSMTSGYNAAMNYSDAKYKIYIHHDTFIIDQSILSKLIKIFNSDQNIGMIGNIGTTHMCPSGKWYESNLLYKRGNFYNDGILNIQLAMSTYTKGSYEHADGIDGIFMSTDIDIPWRDDLFDDWHFYDISQTYEFRKAGLETVFLNNPHMILLHEPNTTKDNLALYNYYADIFLKNYSVN